VARAFTVMRKAFGESASRENAVERGDSEDGRRVGAPRDAVGMEVPVIDRLADGIEDLARVGRSRGGSAFCLSFFLVCRRAPIGLRDRELLVLLRLRRQRTSRLNSPFGRTWLGDLGRRAGG